MSVERRIVTILFADLVDFTPLSERLDAEDVATIQEAYFEVVRDTVGRYGGSLEKFIGDAVMAAFGLGRARDDDAERAVRAGLALVHGVDSLGPRLGLDVDELRIRVGVNTGEAVIGVAVPTEGLGTGQGRVTGDSVNVAARLQAAAPAGRVIVGEATGLAVEGSIELEPAQALTLKGKSQPIRARLVVGVRPEPSRESEMGGMVAPTIGRSRELEGLVAAGRRVAQGSTERILILAPPGVGKSRLLAAFSTRLTEGTEGVDLIWRTRSREGSDAPFALVRGILTAALTGAGLEIPLPKSAGSTGLIPLVEASGVSTARALVIVDAVRGVLDPVSSGPASDVAPDVADRAERFAAWSVALKAVAADRPVCWLAEDLHWAGPDEIAFIERLTQDPEPLALLVVATARPSISERVDTDWARIELGPLPTIDARQLIDALVGDALPDDLVGRIIGRSDGNPLFIEELLRTWVSVGVLERLSTEGRWRLTAGAADVPLPLTIQAIYASQLDDLPGEARATARRASVAGRRFPVDALPELGTLDAEATVAELARRAIVGGPQHDPLVGETYGYRHALVRDAGYASLARAERAALHIRLAWWLAGAAGDGADRIAATIGGHYADALANASAVSSTVGPGLTREAIAGLAGRWLERAGEGAIESAAFADARRHLRRAVDLTAPDDAATLVRRLTRLGDSLTGSGSLDEAVDAYERAVAAAEAALDEETTDATTRRGLRRGLAAAARALGRARFEQTRFAEALDVAERARVRLATEDEASAIGLELLAIESRNALINDAGSLVGEARGLRERAAAIGDIDTVLAATRTDIALRSEVGLVSAEEWHGLADGFVARGRWSEATRAMLRAADAADPGGFETVVAEAERLADAHGQSESLAWLALTRAVRAFVSGFWDQATEQALAAIEIGERYGYHRAVVRTWFVLAPIAAERRDVESLQRAATWFADRERDDTFPDSPFGRLMHTAVDVDLASVGLRAMPPLRIDRFDTALGLAFDSPDWLAAVERVVQAMLRSGHIEAARTAIDINAGSLVDGHEPLADVSLALIRAWLAEADGAVPEAVGQARAGLTLLAESDAPWWSLRLTSVLERVDSATTDERMRAEGLARGLGIARPWANG